MILSKIKCSVTLLCISLLLSCSRTEKVESFVLSGTLVNGKSAKTAYLYAYLPEYGKINMVDSAAVSGSAFNLSGSCDVPTEAFIRLDGSSDAYYFMLSNAELNMQIGNNGYTVTGTPDNIIISSLVMKQRQTVNRQAELQKSYGRHIADSTLTKLSEDSMLRLYRRLPVDFRESLYRAIDTNAVANKPLADLLFRMFSAKLAKEDADSLSEKLQIRMR